MLSSMKSVDPNHLLDPSFLDFDSLVREKPSGIAPKSNGEEGGRNP
jgi:hypothetical protein